MRWRTYEEELLEDGRAAARLSADDRLRALFSLIGFLGRLSMDTGSWPSKLRLHEQDEEEGRRRLREWMRRSRA